MKLNKQHNHIYGEIKYVPRMLSIDQAEIHSHSEQLEFDKLLRHPSWLNHRQSICS